MQVKHAVLGHQERNKPRLKHLGLINPFKVMLKSMILWFKK